MAARWADNNSSGLSAILYAALGDNGMVPNLPLLNVLLERENISRNDKIDALEMAGAVLLAYDKNAEKFPLAYQFWRRALTLRLMDTEESRPIYKSPLKSMSGQLSEWSTLDDLHRIEQFPAQRKIQSFLVRLRILSAQSWNAVYCHFFKHFLHFIYMELAHHESMSEMLDLCWITLDTFLRSDRPHESTFKISELGNVLVFTFERFSKGNPKLNSEILMKIVKLILMTDPSHMTDPKFEPPVAEAEHLYMVCEMFMILSRHPEMITEEVGFSLLQLVRRDGRDPSGSNLLHTACLLQSSDADALSTIRLLVKLEADPNARNNVGNGVLHILAMQRQSGSRDARARLLVELGAHLDMVNTEGMTAADLWFQKNTPEKNDVSDLPDWLQENVPYRK